MNPTLLATTIIISTSILTALVCYTFSRLAMKEVTKEYETLIKKRDQELLQACQDRNQLSKRVAELEAELTLERINEPQVEFFEVPRGRR